MIREVSRRESWEESWRLAPVISNEGESDPLSQAIRERVSNPKRPRTAPGLSTAEVMRSSRELIFFVDPDGFTGFQHIGFGLDVGTFELTVGPTWEITDFDDDNDVKRHLALALAYDVPVVPDTDADAPRLSALERDLFATGVEAIEGGDVHRLVYTPLQGIDIEGPEVLDALRTATPISQGEMRLAISAARRELEARGEAGRLLGSLRLAIAELESLLSIAARNEHDLQRCLTRHPVLFGPEYVDVVPKLRLGGDYELDYALRRASGLVDLVEIEASTHRLFTRKGHPTSALVHAEQQVLDWLDWLELYGGLARRDLPELQRPSGYVVLGRDEGMDDAGLRRLRQRNAIWSGAVQVLTFDGLLNRARSLLNRLEGLTRPDLQATS